MPLHPRRRALCSFLLIVAALVAGCGADRADRADRAAGPLEPAALAVRVDAAEVAAARARARLGHPWFPLTPGRFTDFRIRRRFW